MWSIATTTRSKRRAAWISGSTTPAGSDQASKADVPPALDAQALEDQFKKKIDEAQKQQPGTDGYYIGKSKGKTYGVLLVRSPLSSMDPAAFELRAQIQKLVSVINPQAWDPKLTVGYSGQLDHDCRGETRDHSRPGADRRHGCGHDLGRRFCCFSCAFACWPAWASRSWWAALGRLPAPIWASAT